MGPPGVVVVNSKYLGERVVEILDEVFVDGRHRPYVSAGEHEALIVSKALSAVTGRPVAAASLIALVATCVQVHRQPRGRRVRVGRAEHVVPYLHRLPNRLRLIRRTSAVGGCRSAFDLVQAASCSPLKTSLSCQEMWTAAGRTVPGRGRRDAPCRS